VLDRDQSGGKSGSLISPKTTKLLRAIEVHHHLVGWVDLCIDEGPLSENGPLSAALLFTLVPIIVFKLIGRLIDAFFSF
jgi:hypothetical protein